jgi:nucleotide-binding universal stress UspA family protein
MPAAVNLGELETGVKERVLEELEDFLGDARAAGVKAEGEVLVGRESVEIVERAQTLPADLVVMGTHGRGGFEKWVLGSITEKVIRQAPCPILTVTLPAEDAPPPGQTPFKRILCAIDFSEHSTRALTFALSLAQQAEAHLTLAHVLEPIADENLEVYAGHTVGELRPELEARSRERLRAAVPEDARNWCEPDELIVYGRPWEAILEAVKTTQSNLLVMGVHGRSVVDLALFGSTTNHVVRAARCPVLVIRS